MTAEDMRALIARVEVAEGASFAMDQDIAHAIGAMGMPPKPYTASLDAAVSLVPVGHDWILENVNGGQTICARVGHNDKDRNSWGDTPALALTAAALRARLAMGDRDE